MQTGVIHQKVHRISCYCALASFLLDSGCALWGAGFFSQEEPQLTMHVSLEQQMLPKVCN